MAFPCPLNKFDEARKLEYAAALLRLSEPLQAGQFLFPSAQELGKALYVAQFWTYDPDVLAEKTRLLCSDDGSSILPSKVQTAKNFFDMMRDEELAPKDRIAAGKVFAQIMGYLTTTDGATPNGNDDYVPTEPVYKIVDE